jgi:hypothetical protein
MAPPAPPRDAASLARRIAPSPALPGPLPAVAALGLPAAWIGTDLLARVVRPTPRFATGKGAATFAARAAAKGWTRRWPGVTIAPTPPDRSPRR